MMMMMMMTTTTTTVMMEGVIAVLARGTVGTGMLLRMAEGA